uniref:Baculoviral IAP repeat-containing protein 3 n=1 Tax=Anadara broughtonii TaxID=148819 RepID=A0A7U1BGB3_ANABR|nr:baculoviral IAP repeat-containing protein 3 [Anadara broughtonii]
MPTATINSFIEFLGQSEEVYNKEDNRLASFSTYNGVISAIKLSRKGFFYRQINKEVKCFCCHNTVPVVNLRQTSVLQSVNELHLPNCQWDTPQRNRPSYNRTVELRNERSLEYIRTRAARIRAREENTQLPQDHWERVDSAIYNEPGSLHMAPVGECPCRKCVRPETRFCLVVLEGDHITTTRAGYAELARMYQNGGQGQDYATEEARMATFGDMHEWPNQSALQSKRNLTEAGFFYKGPGDNVQCFHCGGDLRNWDSRSDPWREHARWFPWCEHVRREMGDRFVHDVLMTTGKIRRGHEDREQTIRPDVVKNVLMRGHTMEAISSEIQNFFKETGYYPGYEVLIERLEVQA